LGRLPGHLTLLFSDWIYKQLDRRLLHAKLCLLIFSRNCDYVYLLDLIARLIEIQKVDIVDVRETNHKHGCEIIWHCHFGIVYE
jgi:hypothetical protein